MLLSKLRWHAYKYIHMLLYVWFKKNLDINSTNMAVSDFLWHLSNLVIPGCPRPNIALQVQDRCLKHQPFHFNISRQYSDIDSCWQIAKLQKIHQARLKRTDCSRSLFKVTVTMWTNVLYLGARNRLYHSDFTSATSVTSATDVPPGDTDCTTGKITIL